MGRIYGEKKIKENALKDFWNGRASKYNEDTPYVSIKLGDKNPKRAAEWDRFERENILQISISIGSAAAIQSLSI